MTGGGEDDDTECQYCGSKDTVEEAYHTMCGSCHEAFMSGMEKGQKIDEHLGGVRGRQEILKEIEDEIEEIKEDLGRWEARRPWNSDECMVVGRQRGRKESLEYLKHLLGEDGDL